METLFNKIKNLKLSPTNNDCQWTICKDNTFEIFKYLTESQFGDLLVQNDLFKLKDEQINKICRYYPYFAIGFILSCKKIYGMYVEWVKKLESKGDEKMLYAARLLVPKYFYKSLIITADKRNDCIVINEFSSQLFLKIYFPLNEKNSENTKQLNIEIIVKDPRRKGKFIQLKKIYFIRESIFSPIVKRLVFINEKHKNNELDINVREKMSSLFSTKEFKEKYKKILQRNFPQFKKIYEDIESNTYGGNKLFYQCCDISEKVFVANDVIICNKKTTKSGSFIVEDIN